MPNAVDAQCDTMEHWESLGSAA